jgi:serine protease
MGYAYPNIDSDSDGLVDGMELVIGSNPSSPGGAQDAITYPLAGVPTGDPCLGAAAANCSADRIFSSGFQ